MSTPSMLFGYEACFKDDDVGDTITMNMTVEPSNPDNMFTLATNGSCYYSLDTSILNNTHAGNYTLKIHGYDYAATVAQHNYHTILFNLTENQPPQVNASNTVVNQTMIAYETLNYAIPTDIFIEPESETMNYSAIITPSEPFISVAAGIASLNVTTGSNNNHTGDYVITLRATDTHSPDTATTEFNFTLTITANQAPTVNASNTVANQTMIAYDTLNYAIPTDVFLEPESETMNYSAVITPSETFISVAADIASLNVTTGSNNSHVGDYVITLRATDTHSPDTATSK
jgi:hypothetical protein